MDVTTDAIGQGVDRVACEAFPLEVALVRRRRRELGDSREGGEARAAGLAVADTVDGAAVVDLVESEPVEEEAVDVVAIEDLVEDVEGAVLVVLAARADADEPLVYLSGAGG